ncbi:unnamed protein product [Gongylonema pulchrum]|uniref:Uncharacterized protein n=1 Tax=Gongylonema pulchrum TaxID=637853 RepID=A0A183ELQ7_9BILA|nr:unnamed protein product [Gongylonema pulchrum]
MKWNLKKYQSRLCCVHLLAATFDAPTVLIRRIAMEKLRWWKWKARRRLSEIRHRQHEVEIVVLVGALVTTERAENRLCLYEGSCIDYAGKSRAEIGEAQDIETEGRDRHPKHFKIDVSRPYALRKQPDRKRLFESTQKVVGGYSLLLKYEEKFGAFVDHIDGFHYSGDRLNYSNIQLIIT